MFYKNKNLVNKNLAVIMYSIVKKEKRGAGSDFTLPVPFILL